jgi:hypothetical protein
MPDYGPKEKDYLTVYLNDDGTISDNAFQAHYGSKEYRVYLQGDDMSGIFILHLVNGAPRIYIPEELFDKEKDSFFENLSPDELKWITKVLVLKDKAAVLKRKAEKWLKR